LGTYYVHFVVPNFALQLKLSFHDTFNFDMGPSGEGFKIHVTDVQVEVRKRVFHTHEQRDNLNSQHTHAHARNQRDGKVYEARHDPLTHTLELISEI